jgi:nitroreductase
MKKSICGFTKEQLQEMDPELLRALLREQAHVAVDYPLNQASQTGKKLPGNFGDSLRELLRIWESRALPCDREDIQWCYQLLVLSAQVAAGKQSILPEQKEHFFQEEQEVVIRLIQTRRSIRGWRDQPVPAQLLEKIMEAGLWAPHSCNLQTIRYLLLEGDEIQQLYQVSRLRGTPVCILIAQDMRPYECFKQIIPPPNRDLECGAAIQNILLYAHALGLGAVWLTFEKGEAEALHKKYQLPEYILLMTYLAIGWPAQGSFPPGRKSVKDALLPKERTAF